MVFIGGIDVGDENRNGIVAVAQDLEGAELLRKVAQRCRLDFPEAVFGPLSCATSGRRRLRRDDVDVPMPGDPQDQIRIIVQRAKQLRIAHHARRRDEERIVSRGRIERLLRMDRNMRGDDHQLVVQLPFIELSGQPVEPPLVESAPGVVGLRQILPEPADRIVEHDELERKIGFRLKAVAGTWVIEFS